MTPDQSVLNFFVEHRTEWLTPIMSAASFLGGWPWVIGVLVFAAVYFYYRRRGIAVFLLILTVIGSAGTTFVLKHLIGRGRPPLAEMIGLETDPSFPSGHATTAVALYGFLTYMLWRSAANRPQKILPAVFLSALIILIGISRLYLGMHYLSDVLAGYAIGLLWILIARRVSRSKIWRLLDNERP